MNSGSSRDLSLSIGDAINVEGLEGWNRSGWKEETVDKRRVDEVSCSPTIYEGCSDNGSRSIL